jgi:hypothetical protein
MIYDKYIGYSMSNKKHNKNKWHKIPKPKWMLDQISHVNSIRDEIIVNDDGMGPGFKIDRSILYGKGL